ncbi:MAG: PolC-type DNA polymerase III [Lachnospiraceae bacterium]|nr:PolC-type DNA polymerase III [Lachnospiraceae bacterium]
MEVKNSREKKFFEAFRTLELTNGLSGMLKDTVIEHIIHHKGEDRIKIFLRSDHIIGREELTQAEKEIEKQLFQGKQTAVRIYERFELPKRYDLSAIFDEYRDSLLFEIRCLDRLLYTVFKNAEAKVSSDCITLGLDNQMTQAVLEQKLSSYFERIFSERFQLPVEVRYTYRSMKRQKGYVSSASRFENELQLIRFSYEKQKEGAVGESSETLGEASPTSEKTAKRERKQGNGGNGNGSDPSGSFSRFKAKGRVNHPDLIYGKYIEEEPIPIAETYGVTGEVTVRGRIIRFESRETKSGKTIFIFELTDYTDTVAVKMFPRDEAKEELAAALKEGNCVLLRGESGLDSFDGEFSISRVYGLMKSADIDSENKRVDLAEVKRVELHCHTKMSDMDGVSDVSDIIKRAAGWGQKAIAITDHGLVQAFTDAFHTLQKLGDKYPDFKLIYGMEGYLVDDTVKICVEPGDHRLDGSFVIFDIETTGFSPEEDEIIEIGAVRVENGEVKGTFSEFVDPGRPIPYRITQLTGITNEMVSGAEGIDTVLPEFLAFSEGAVFVAHNASFDTSFIREKAKRLGLAAPNSYVDTVGLARLLLSKLSRFKLDTVAKALNVVLKNHHRAVDDAEACAGIFLKLSDLLKQQGINTLEEINELSEKSDEIIKKAPTYHVILLAKNEIGRINLYRLVSLSHTKYFQKVQRIPKSLIEKYREGLIIGSACEAGELYRALLEEKSEEEIQRIVNFYDYLEIQPCGNNAFLIEEKKHDKDNSIEYKKYEKINSIEDIQKLNRRIVELGERYHKPVAATCDVHFLDPEDEVYRRIIMTGNGFKDADSQAPLFLRTTEEMLGEFSYLGAEKAYEVVVENTVKIANMVDRIEPVRPDKCPPVIPDSDGILKDICYRKAHEIYGETLPGIVEERLEKELNSIITNGFAVMYIIAQKLVWKSVEDGYLVGSRGSVGSSLVATMAGITEVNPLPPHYLCPSCHYVDFDSEEVKAYAGRAGCDMPDRICPNCGKPLSKEGFDIPFETFLGFKGDKEPDIDLNFSGEYQSKAHKYTEVIFGDGQTYRAGTIGTLADKTAYGYVKKYFEEKGIKKRACEINRITKGCTGIHRTTGQHPGGIIVLPLGEEITTFTPIQHPANRAETGIITTHFDYHSIDHNLLKLDILGHDDPTMIRMLQDLTDTDPTKVPLDDKEVMTLFQDTKALGISPSDIGGTRLGTLGVPEFGTDFAMQMLIDAKPQAFSDLVRIAGLAHGTDVWLGNAETLIKEGKATIATAICTRDDIMVYLINQGLDPAMAFSIMENVRKGNVAKGKCAQWPEWEKAMTEAGVPDWYIWSCTKIQYMFPKAHAAAYVMMAWRIAYYKVNYPLAYYCAYFSIRADGMNYEKMCQGLETLENWLEDYKKRSEELSKKEEDELREMRLAEEMYKRGFEFMPIDLFAAEAHKCRMINGKIMPRLDCIDGLGGTTADSVYNACKDGAFLSKQDFQERTGANQTVMETLIRLGILNGLPDTNQLSIFDLMTG